MSNECLVINIAGQIGTGKSTVADRLETTFGFTVYSPDKDILAYAHGQKMPLKTRSEYNEAARLLLSSESSALVQPVLRMSGNICVDGLHVLQRAERLQKLLGESYKTIATDCHEELVLSRLKRRNTPPLVSDETHIDRPKLHTIHSINNASQGPLDINIDRVVAEADAVINTDGCLPATFRALEKILKPWLPSSQ